MVVKATENDSRAWSNPLPSRTDMFLRRISAIALIAGLLTIVTPFAPFSWLFPAEGPEMLDRFFSMPVVLGALFFQWRISGVVGSLPVQIADSVFLYRHAMYWKMAAAEAAIIVGVNLGNHEIWRRFVGVGIVAVLWALGWGCTPERYKKEAWEHLKWMWMWMAFNEARGISRRGRGFQRGF